MTDDLLINPDVIPTLLYLPVTNKIINLSQISSIDPDPPRKRRYEFPELRTEKPRPKETKWRLVISMAGGEKILLRDREAENFFNLVKTGIMTLLVKESESEEAKEKEKEIS